MNNRSSKTKQCFFAALLYCYIALNGFGFISEVKACTRLYQDKTRVLLSVNVVDNTLQVYWENLESSKYYLVLAGYYEVSNFSKNGEGDFRYWKNGRQYVYKTINPTKSSDFVQTDVKFDRTHFDRVVSDENFGYYVHITTPSGNVTKTYCMKMYPTWMNDYKSQIGNISLISLFIPGTHDSACYFTTNSANDYAIKNKFSITQGWEDVRSQLRMGARYLDIRVGHYPSSDERFWTVHAVVSMHTLKNILAQVRQFVRETNEIVIFDIHGFEKGFSYLDEHKQLVQFIISQIGELMVDPSIGWSGTLNKIWATGRRIIVSYKNTEVEDLFPNHLWSATNHRWGNKNYKSDLKNYLYDKHRLRLEYLPQTDCAVLTPPITTVVFDSIASGLLTALTLGIFNPLSNSDHSDTLFSGVNYRAQDVNHDLTLWYLHDLGRTSNIVAVDYILGTNIIEVAMYWNLRKN